MKKLPLLAALAVLLVAPVALGAATARLSITKVAAGSQEVTVKGKVALPGATAATWRRTRVALSLTDDRGTVQRFTARPDSTGRFKKTVATELTGRLALRGRVTVGGRRSGALVTRPGAVVVGQATGSAGREKLVGLFKLDPGIDQPSGGHSGTFFQMFSPNGPPMRNNSSPSKDKNFTPLPPGTDGGLRTDVYQEPPSPAFSGGNIGDALAARITQPQEFFSTKFSVVTSPTDLQAGAPDPLPEIYVDDNGRLSGQLTAWVAQWNGNSFNQGTPKPDGTLPGTTTPLHGTFDRQTGRYALEWKSLIVGGPFNGFTGSWHLEGTFVPA